ncbi:MAG: alpha/beta hydrolase-fold protein [Opitutaceae bacterium]
MKLVSLFLLLTLSVFAQQNAAPQLNSPVVNPDRTVTFKIAAPKATEVTLKGDWNDDAKKLEKGADGVWSITVGPMPPSSYIYGYTVDGVAIADPVNPRIKLRMRGSGSYFVVPGDGPGIQEPRDVPRGAVETIWQKSSVLGDVRQILVYTPPGYTQETARRYPVLYLLHGSNDRPNGWVDVGNINFIADNLVAEGKAVPMVIVMPITHALPFGERGGQGGRNNTTVFEEYLLKDVMPTVAAKYRIAPGRQNAALAGQSMGGELSCAIFFHQLDRFSSMGALSPSGFRAIETEHAALLKDAAGTNAKIDLLWIACGRQDPSHFNGSQRLAEVLETNKIRHIWRPSEGYHNYPLWRDHITEFLTLLFKSK